MPQSEEAIVFIDSILGWVTNTVMINCLNISKTNI